MSRTERAAKGAFTSLIQYTVTIGLQLILAPVVLRTAGQETLGAYAILMQAIGYLVLVDVGFSVSMSRYLAQAFGYDDDGERFRRILTTGRTFQFGSNAVFALLALLLTIRIAEWFSLTPAVASQARIALIMLAFWAIVRTPWVVFGGGLIATQDLVTANIIGLVGNISRLIFSLCLVLAGMGLVGLVLANIIAEALTITAYRVRFLQKYRTWKPGWGIPDSSLFRSMFVFGTQVLFINLAVRLVLYTDNIVVGYLYGAAAVSVYYTTQMPATLGFQIVNRLTDNATPAINELHARGEQVTLRRTYLKITRYTLTLVLLLIVGLLTLNNSFIILWVGSEQYAGDLMTVALAVFALLITMGHVSSAFVMATGQIRTLSLLSVSEGLTNLALSLWLGRLIGLAGVMWATAIANTMSTGYLYWRATRDLKIDAPQFARECLLPTVGPALFAYAVASVFVYVWPPTDWFAFGVASMVLIVTYFIVGYWTILTKLERSWILSHTFRLLRGIDLRLLRRLS